MILLNILDIKDTMSHLLIKDSFDNFFIEEAYVLTYAGLTINGRRNKEWYDSDEKELPSLLRWNEVKKFISLVTQGRARITDLNETVLEWIKNENLEDKFAIKFR